MIGEILAEVWHDVSSEPLVLVLEVVQFSILAALVYGIAWGFGIKRGFVRNMLAEARTATLERVGQAQAMPARLDAAKSASTRRRREARAQARKLVADARLEAERLQAEGEAQAEEEAARLLRHADEAIDNERAEAQAEIREQLVELVARSTRAIMNERLSIAEQRKLIEGAVFASIGSNPDAGSPAPDSRAAGPAAGTR